MKIVLAVRGSEKWREWIYRLCDHAGKTSGDLIYEALREYAKRVKFREPPPPRGDEPPES